MEIIVNLDCLKKQIRMCDMQARNSNNKEERELFYGIADFLDNIDYAIEKGATVNIVKD